MGEGQLKQLYRWRNGGTNPLNVLPKAARSRRNESHPAVPDINLASGSWARKVSP